MTDLISSELVQTNVTSVKFIGNSLLAGIAGDVCIFKLNASKYKPTWDLVFKSTVLQEQGIHGIIDKNQYVLVYGGKCLALLNYSSDSSFQIVLKWNTDDWILDVSWMSNGLHVAVLTAHNTLVEYNVNSGHFIRSVSCSERCILYSARIVNSEWVNIISLAGTVFQEIVVWASSSLSTENERKPVLHRLKGHKGVIFYVDYDYRSQTICSTSDDRTVRIWMVRFPDSTDSRETKNWEQAEISLKHTVFGHTARVWRSQFLSNQRIVSVGEDSLVCIWDKCGNCERQWTGHQGGAIWSLDCSENLGFIATGGSDGGVCLWPLANIDPLKALRINSVKNDSDVPFVPKSLAITYSGDIITTTECGKLMMYRNGNWKLCFSDSHISSYCIQDMTDSRQRLALGTITGHILIFSVKEGELMKSVDLNTVNQKIFAIHWAEDSTLVTCEREGILKVWELKWQEGLERLKMIKKFVLPFCKERWTTSALLHKGYLICGDRMGSIHLYEMCLTNVDLQMPVDSLLKIHGSRGVSSLQYVNNSLMSTGRDGTVRRLAVDNGKLQLLSTDKLQMDWAAVIRHTKAFGTIVIGFHDVYFVIWSIVERRYLLKIDCRGGHRSWDYLVDEDCSNLKLAFIQNKDVHYFCNPISRIYNNSPLMGYHTKTINSGSILPILSSGDVVLLTGSEDTTLRTLRISDNALKPDIILRNHVSSVRTVYSLLCSYNSTTYIFSAGGRGQMKVWKMSFDDKGETFAVELASHMVRCEKDIHRPWQKALPLPDPETRYMDLTVLEMCPPLLLIIAGCSDGMLRFLNFDTLTLQLMVAYVFEHHQHCILRVLHFKLKDTSMVVSMATDGKAAFWNVDEILDSSQEEIAPFDHSLHSLGINSCAFQIQSGKLILSTGSDDTSIGVNVFDFDNIFKPKIVASWSRTDLHSCQITGICMTESFILTAALDQRVHLLKWKFSDHCLEVQPVKRFISYIPDIHGALLWQSDCGSNKMRACIFGEGIQILSVNEDKMGKEITEVGC